MQGFFFLLFIFFFFFVFVFFFVVVFFFFSSSSSSSSFASSSSSSPSSSSSSSSSSSPSSSFSAFPAIPPGFIICGALLIVVVSLLLFFFNFIRGWCMLGVFLLPAFTRLGHECQDLLSPYNGMHACTDKGLGLYSHPKSYRECSQNPCSSSSSSRLCPSTAGCSPPSMSSIFVCLLLS